MRLIYENYCTYTTLTQKEKWIEKEKVYEKCMQSFR